MFVLHLEISFYRVQNDYKIPVTTSPPIVVYREGVGGKGGPFEGKSPNKHNRFYMEALPLESKVVEAIRAGEIASGQRIKDSKALAKKLEELGVDRNEAKNVRSEERRVGKEGRCGWGRVRWRERG